MKYLIIILLFPFFVFGQTAHPIVYPSSTGAYYNTWTNPSNAYTSNDQYAVISSINNYQSWEDFNFSLPDSLAIAGIEVFIEGYATSVTTTVYTALRINGAGGFTTYRTISVGTTEGIYSTGSRTVLWITSNSILDFDSTDFINANFSIAGYIANTGRTVYVDQIGVRVHYGIHTGYNVPSSYDAYHSDWTNPDSVYTSDDMRSIGTYTGTVAYQSWEDFNFHIVGGDTFNIVNYKRTLEFHNTGTVSVTPSMSIYNVSKSAWSASYSNSGTYTTDVILNDALNTFRATGNFGVPTILTDLTNSNFSARLFVGSAFTGGESTKVDHLKILWTYCPIEAQVDPYGVDYHIIRGINNNNTNFYEWVDSIYGVVK